MAELELVAEEDADLNRNGKPAMNVIQRGGECKYVCTFTNMAKSYSFDSSNRPVSNAGVESQEGDLDLIISRDQRVGESSSRSHASRPDAAPMDFVVRPQSKIDPEEIRAHAKQAMDGQRRMKAVKVDSLITDC